MRKTQRLSTRQTTSDESFARTPTGVRAKILEEIKHYPRSVDELMRDLELSHSTCSSAVNHLMRQGFIANLGVTSITSAGRRCIVWEAVEDPPKPITAPTRRDLEQRISSAIAAINAQLPRETILAILTGASHV